MIWTILVVCASLVHGDDPPAGRFTSPSGEWTLTVGRPEKDWNGVNELVLWRGETEVWHGRHELGVRFALVSDDGRSAGFGYTGEPDPWVTGTSDGPFGRVLRVFAFDSTGHLVLDDSHARELPLRSGGPCAPRARGAFLVPELGRFVLRLDDEDSHRGAEEWRAYDLASGETLFRERPRPKLGLPDALGSLLDARAVPGTPLVLLQWQRVESRERSFGITDVYQLVDADWNLAWTRELASERPRKPGQDWLSTGARGTTLGQARFELHPPGGAGTVAFAVQRAGERWNVSEAAR